MSSTTSPPQAVELVAATLEELILSVGRGVGEAQRELDRSSISIQRTIDADPLLTEHGVQATWYQIPRTELEVKVALAFQGSAPAAPPGGRAALTAALNLERVFIHPINARYQNLFSYDATAASTLRLTIVPVPPRVSEGAQAPPRLTDSDVRRIATPALEHDPGTSDPRRDTRLAVSFDPTTRIWHVIQFTEAQGVTTTVALVDVNDTTGTATRR